MAKLLMSWKEPVASVRARQKLDGLFLVLKWVAVAAVLATMIRHISSGNIPALLASILFISILCIFGRVHATYQISDVGVSYVDGHRRLHINWNEIEWYHVAFDKDVPNLKHVQFAVVQKVWIKTPPAFVFDPQNVDEQHLLQTSNRFLPDKQLHALTMHQMHQGQTL